jgi:hypothetical protein
VDDRGPDSQWRFHALSPRQIAWSLDGQRRFDGEFGYDCFGPVRFVDPDKGIDSYAGDGYPPQVTVDSDDPDVIFSVFRNGRRPFYSTDGGRHFYADAREFPMASSLKFMAVRNGRVYAGLEMYDRDDGYLTWSDTNRLVVLEAELEKSRGRIGRYRLLVPRNHRFKDGIPAYAGGDVRYVDTLDSLRLPREARAPEPMVCDRLHLPPYQDAPGGDPVEFISWVAATARANPGWMTIEKLEYASRIRKRYHRLFEKPGVPDIHLDDLVPERH